MRSSLHDWRRTRLRLAGRHRSRRRSDTCRAARTCKRMASGHKRRIMARSGIHLSRKAGCPIGTVSGRMSSPGAGPGWIVPLGVSHLPTTVAGPISASVGDGSPARNGHVSGRSTLRLWSRSLAWVPGLPWVPRLPTARSVSVRTARLGGCLWARVRRTIRGITPRITMSGRSMPVMSGT
jgi:hypothetical protein